MMKARLTWVGTEIRKIKEYGQVKLPTNKYVQRALQPQKIGIWIAISRRRLIGMNYLSYYFDFISHQLI
jgi:hypothetical protein